MRRGKTAHVFWVAASWFPGGGGCAILQPLRGPICACYNDGVECVSGLTSGLEGVPPGAASGGT
jgi:hypothetical protein